MIENVTEELITAAIIAVMMAALTWGKRIFKQWRERPSAQQQRENDAISTRRIAESTHRFVALTSYLVLYVLTFLSIAGAAAVAWAGATVGFLVIGGWPAWSILAGLLLSGGITCVMGMREIEKVLKALREVEQQKLSQMN